MSESLLHYFNRELTFLKRMGAEFAERYPKVAGRLRIAEETVEDPHVSRLLEGVALMTAQVRQKLDDSFPELTDALLGQVYPDFQAPIPSMTTLHITTQNLTDASIRLAAGARVTSSASGFEDCEYRTCYDARIWPLEIPEVRFENAPHSAPKHPRLGGSGSVLKIALRCQYSSTRFSDLDLDQLRFHIHGQSQQSLALYRMLFKHCMGAVVVPADRCKEPAFISARQLQAVGFADEQQVVPYSDRTFAGFRLLVEQMVFPDKFLYFDINGLKAHWPGYGNSADLYLYFDEPNAELEGQIGPEHLLLNCVPVINLFEKSLEPFRLDPGAHEYLLQADYDAPEDHEVIRLTQMRGSLSGIQSFDILPFYGQCHPDNDDSFGLFWTARREASQWAGGRAEPGSELYLSIVDNDYQSVETQMEDRLLVAPKALCSNRNLPARQPFGGGLPEIAIEHHKDMLAEVRCLTAPTAVVRPQLQDATRWQLIASLNLHHFSQAGGCEQLKQLLYLYDFKQSAETRALVDGIVALRVKPATARVVEQGRVGFCRGSDIELVFTHANLGGRCVFFVGAVLERFFAQFASINSFTRTTLFLENQDKPYHQWPARVGTRALL